MTWWGWMLFGLYWLCALYALPRIAYVITDDLTFSRVEGADIAFAYFLGLVFCGAWPVVWAGYAWFRHAQGRDFAGMLVPPRPIRRTKEREQMQRRIRELEQELNIR